MGLSSFLSSWQFVLFFYILVGFIVYKNRNKFDFQAKFIALYRTKVGLKLMKNLGEKHRKLVRFLGYVGILVGYVGMIIIVFYIFQGIYNLIAVPEAPPTIAPVIPGVKIPGSPIFVPFWYGIISLFMVILIHEFSHGVVAKAHKIKVKSSGFVLFGPLPGAFVEPDEKVLVKKKAAIQNSVFAAGPFSNILTALVIILLFSFVMSPIIDNYFPGDGIAFSNIVEGAPAHAAGLETNVRYDIVNGAEVHNTLDFLKQLEDLKPGESISIGNGLDNFEVITADHPQRPGEGYLGVNIITRFSNDETIGFKIVQVVVEFLNWLLLLSLGLGLANLLPIGPVDGGRMYQIACRRFFGTKKGDLVWAKTSMLFLFIILILLFIPIIRAVV